MKRSIALRRQNNCSTCAASQKGFFCRLGSNTLADFESIKSTAVYQKGRILFAQGHPSTGVYMLCQGRVKLSACSPGGKSVIFRIAKAGEILGLSAAISEMPFRTTAEAMGPCQVNFIEKGAFLRFLKTHSDAGFNANHQLSQNYGTACSQIRLLALSSSAAEKLATLLWSWASQNDATGRSPFSVAYTHQEIADMIGASRETVTRLLSDFKDRGLISIRGSSVTIRNSEYIRGRAR